MNRHSESFYNFINEVKGNNLRYVAIRGFINLPQKPDTDIDVVVHFEDYEKFCAIAKARLGVPAAHEDFGFAEYCRMLYRPFATLLPQDNSLPNGCFRVDSYNSLFFYSPYHSYTTRWTLPKRFNDRVFANCYYSHDFWVDIPKPEDEISLLVCRNILDFQGNWKEKHVQRIKTLLPLISRDSLVESIGMVLPYAEKVVEAVYTSEMPKIKSILKI